VLFQRVREAERAVVYRNYSDRVGEMINGIVKRMDRGAIIVELGDTEGIIPATTRCATSATARATGSARWWWT
jgi:N utilization substance protein A